jgi:hypothetical protein
MFIPNPATSGRLTLELGPGRFEIRISDLHGKIKKDLGAVSQNILEIEFDGPPGVYVLEISGLGEKVYKKIVLQ